MINEPRMEDAFPDGGRRLGSSLAQEVAGAAIRDKPEIVEPKIAVTEAPLERVAVTVATTEIATEMQERRSLPQQPINLDFRPVGR